MSIVAVLGSGVMATALSVPLTDNGHEVRLIGTHLDRTIIEEIQATGVHPGLGLRVPRSVRAWQLEDAPAAFDGAEVVLSGVNSFGVRWAGRRLAELLRPGMLVISIAKGLESTEEGDLRILPDVLAEEVPPQLRSAVSWSAVAGPSIAGEVASRRPTCVLFVGREQEALDRLAALFRTGFYHVWTSTDIVGGEVCAAMKNCYALSVGFAEGELNRMGPGNCSYRSHNYEAALFGQGSVEIAHMLRILGGRPETQLGLAGMGDMYVTSTGGRNVRAGRLIGSGLRFSEAHERLGSITLEGAFAIEVVGRALPKLTERGIIRPADFPLMRHLYEVIRKDQPLQVPWDAMFGGEPTGELKRARGATANRPSAERAASDPGTVAG